MGGKLRPGTSPACSSTSGAAPQTTKIRGWMETPPRRRAPSAGRSTTARISRPAAQARLPPVLAATPRGAPIRARASASQARPAHRQHLLRERHRRGCQHPGPDYLERHDHVQHERQQHPIPTPSSPGSSATTARAATRHRPADSRRLASRIVPHARLPIPATSQLPGVLHHGLQTQRLGALSRGQSLNGSLSLNGDIFVPNGTVSGSFGGGQTTYTFIEANAINASMSGNFLGDGPELNGGSSGSIILGSDSPSDSAPVAHPEPGTCSSSNPSDRRVVARRHTGVLQQRPDRHRGQLPVVQLALQLLEFAARC